MFSNCTVRLHFVLLRIVILFSNSGLGGSTLRFVAFLMEQKSSVWFSYWHTICMLHPVGQYGLRALSILFCSCGLQGISNTQNLTAKNKQRKIFRKNGGTASLLKQDRNLNFKQNANLTCHYKMCKF